MSAEDIDPLSTLVSGEDIDPLSVFQVGGGKRARVSSSSFKCTGKYTSRDQRIRFIKEETRSLDSRIAYSSVVSNVFTEQIDLIKTTISLAENEPKNCEKTILSVVSKRTRLNLIEDLARTNNVEQRIKILADAFFHYVEDNTCEVECLITALKSYSLRSMEQLVVLLWGSSTGDIQWQKLYRSLSKCPKHGIGGATSSTGHHEEEDEDDDDDDDDDDDKGNEDEEMPDIGTISIATPTKSRRGRPKKTG